MQILEKCSKLSMLVLCMVLFWNVYISPHFIFCLCHAHTVIVWFPFITNCCLLSNLRPKNIKEIKISALCIAQHSPLREQCFTAWRWQKNFLTFLICDNKIEINMLRLKVNNLMFSFCHNNTNFKISAAFIWGLFFSMKTLMKTVMNRKR